MSYFNFIVPLQILFEYILTDLGMGANKESKQRISKISNLSSRGFIGGSEGSRIHVQNY